MLGPSEMPLLPFPQVAGEYYITGLWCCLGEYQIQSCQVDV